MTAARDHLAAILAEHASPIRCINRGCMTPPEEHWSRMSDADLNARHRLHQADVLDAAGVRTAEQEPTRLTEAEKGKVQIEVAALRAGHAHMRDVFAVIESIVADRTFVIEAERDEWKAVAHDGAFQQSRAEEAEARLADVSEAYRLAAEVADRFRDVVSECLSLDENPGDDSLVAMIRDLHGKSGPEPRRWRDFVAAAVAQVDQINAGRAALARPEGGSDAE